MRSSLHFMLSVYQHALAPRYDERFKYAVVSDECLPPLSTFHMMPLPVMTRRVHMSETVISIPNNWSFRETILVCFDPCLTSP